MLIALIILRKARSRVVHRGEGLKCFKPEHILQGFIFCILIIPPTFPLKCIYTVLDAFFPFFFLPYQSLPPPHNSKLQIIYPVYLVIFLFNLLNLKQYPRLGRNPVYMPLVGSNFLLEIVCETIAHLNLFCFVCLGPSSYTARLYCSQT